MYNSAMPRSQSSSQPTVTPSEVAALAKRVKDYDEKAKYYAIRRDTLKPTLVAAMRTLGTKVLETGSVRVVLSEPTETRYDSDGIYTALKPSKRKLAFDEVVNLNLLPAAERKELQDKLAELLTPTQRRRCTEYRFNIERMSLAVQEGKIPIEVLDQHTEVVAKTAYTTVTLK